ncbi:MAG: hypothetical protein PUB96_06060 [Helicobacteraceae bacterium]|nr:hypothetical protein [Helicobacteraceae bacterium]
MLFSGNYSLGNVISAVLTFALVLLILRFGLYLANRKNTKIQKPDWVEGDKFDLKRRKK